MGGGGELGELYAALGDVVRGRLPGWQVGLLVADGTPVARTGLPFAARFRTADGGIPVRFLVARTGRGGAR